ncbi:AAA family ATPase, partial [bacterium]|nr:AAA family ATPase [bacterium]
MISSISIQGFKSYKSLKDFSLRPLNILIGPNRSGKTNFLDFWDLLSRAAKRQLAQTINRRGGIDSVIGWNQNPTLQWELYFEAQEPFSQEGEIYYAAEITKQQLTYSVTHESLIKKSVKIGSQVSDLELLNISSGRGRIYNELTKMNQEQEGWIAMTDLVITQIRDTIPFDAAAYSTLNKLRRYLANITVHPLFDTDEDSPIRNAQPVGVSEADLPPTRLNRRGDNLTNVLYSMHNDPQYQDYYEEYLTT